MDPANPNENGPSQSLILRQSSGLVGLPEGRSAPLEEMILRSLDHLSESAGLIALEPRPGEERDFQIAPGVTMRMCWCPPGKFLMGSPESEEGRQEDEGQVRVVLSKGFWMGKTQVTQAQWQAVMGNNPSYFKGADLPVHSVSWKRTCAFIEKLSKRTGNADGGKMFLPTEAQWEYAARTGLEGVYSVGELDEVAWHRRNSGFEPHSVGTKKENRWGLQDMTGNIWEWCQDWHHDNLAGGQDPSGPSAGSHRVARGGSCCLDANYCRVACRYKSEPTHKPLFIGFRVARSSAQ
jgi:formylglycine-generating enzyme required for sulfatase activity